MATGLQKGKESKLDQNGDQDSTKKVEYDDLLTAAGKFGRYQLLLMLSTCPFYMFGVFSYYSQIFITEVSPNHWCWIPELENLTVIDRRNLAIPSDPGSEFGYSRCTAYVADWTEVLETGKDPDAVWDTTPCRHGWEFNQTEIPYATISSELGWVCDRNSYQATAQSLFFVGSIVGGIIIGWVADKYGRIPAAVASNLLGFAGGVGSAFANDFVQFVVCRFIMGMSYDNCMMMIYLLVLEYVAPQYRSIMANVSFGIFYSFFVTVLPFIALAIGDWQTTCLVTSVPLGLAIFTPLIIPESPRWLISKGRVDEAVNKIQTIGRINKNEVPLKLIEQFKAAQLNETQEESVSCVEILKRPLLRKNFVVICLVYMSCTIAFDGLVRSIGQLNFDFFLSFAVVSVTEFPSVLLCAFAMDFFGRRWMAGLSLIISCVFSLLIAFNGIGVQGVIYAMIARFFVNFAYNTSMQWAAELMPTGVRGTSVSVVHICGYVGTVISPYIVYLGTIISWLPMLVIGALAGIGGLLALILPETLNKDMPYTFEDAENLSRNQKFLEFPCLNRKKPDTFTEYVNGGLEM